MRDSSVSLWRQPPLKSFFFVVLFDLKVNQNLEFKSIRMPFAQGSQVGSEEALGGFRKVALVE